MISGENLKKRNKSQLPVDKQRVPESAVAEFQELRKDGGKDQVWKYRVLWVLDQVVKSWAVKAYYYVLGSGLKDEMWLWC